MSGRRSIDGKDRGGQPYREASERGDGSIFSAAARTLLLSLPLAGVVGCAPQASQPPTPTPGQQADLFQRRVLDAIDAHRSAVVTSAQLGEGPGAWDSQPRVPDGATTDLLWLHTVLASAYTDEPTGQQRIQDALRYYDGRIAFSHRKHFVDRWLVLEPGPLAPVRACEPDLRESLSLPLAKLRERRRYGCAMHAADQAAVTLRYFSARGAAMCAGRLEDGSYVLFGVTSERTRRRQRLGPVAQVQPALLTISSGFATVTTADASEKRVTSAGLDEFIGGNSALSGFTIYALDPGWQAPSIVDQRDEEAKLCGS